MLPVELLPIFTPRELEQLLCGKSAIDVGLLKRVAAYEFMQPTDACVQWLWEVLEEMAPEQRVQFINFCYARWWGGQAYPCWRLCFGLQKRNAGVLFWCWLLVLGRLSSSVQGRYSVSDPYPLCCEVGRCLCYGCLVILVNVCFASEW